MNIVFDDGLQLDDAHREVLSTLLPLENAPLRLDAATAKTDGTPSSEEGFVFLTELPVDVLKYHSEFFKRHRDAPQWFFVLLSKSDHGLSMLRNAGIRYGLKNVMALHAGTLDTFHSAIQKIAQTKRVLRGKTLLLTKHVRKWPAELAGLIFRQGEPYQIMDAVHLEETDAENLLLCGESAADFCNVPIPENMEPRFVFRYRGELQDYMDPEMLTAALAEWYHMTAERVASRLWFVDLESEKWLSAGAQTCGRDAVGEGILLWDRFGLPVSRREYTLDSISTAARKRHEALDELRKTVL